MLLRHEIENPVRQSESKKANFLKIFIVSLNHEKAFILLNLLVPCVQWEKNPFIRGCHSLSFRGLRWSQFTHRKLENSPFTIETTTSTLWACPVVNQGTINQPLCTGHRCKVLLGPGELHLDSHALTSF